MSDDLDQWIKRRVSAIVEASPMAPNFASVASRSDAPRRSVGRTQATKLWTVAILVIASATTLMLLVSAGPVPANRNHPTQRQTSFLPFQVTSHASPSASYGATMVYFPPEHEVILFGGANAYGRGLGGTWVLNTHGWHELHLQVAPPRRAQYGMAYDPALRQLVLFGGCSFCGAPGFKVLLDTWAFDGTAWHELHSSTVPSYEPSPLLAWDSETRTFDMFAPPPGYGVSPPNGDFNSDTSLGRWYWGSHGWVWAGSVDLQAFVPPSALVQEPGAKQMLYFSYQPYSGTCLPPTRCGADPSGLFYSETWTWNGKVFVKNRPTRAPRSSEAVTSDTRIGSIVAVADGDAWRWNGTTWLDSPLGLPKGFQVQSAVYDPPTGQVVIWGMAGSAHPHPETWAWVGHGAARRLVG